MEERTLFVILELTVLLAFYGLYYAKVLLQKKKGIRTYQFGACEDRKTRVVEVLLTVATVGVIVAQLLSVVMDRSAMPSSVRLTGFALAMVGDAFFGVSAFTMRDSWRAGIPATDETSLVTGGIYRFSRNPAFVGFDLMYLGMLMMLFNGLTLFFTVFATVMLHQQILREERFLDERFGKSYRDYRAHVNRYLGRR